MQGRSQGDSAKTTGRPRPDDNQSRLRRARRLGRLQQRDGFRLLVREFVLQADHQVLELRQRTQREFQRSEEHTSELQSQSNLVCRLLLEKKKNKKNNI